MTTDEIQDKIGRAFAGKLLEIMNVPENFKDPETGEVLNLAAAIFWLTNFYTGAIFYMCDSEDALHLLQPKLIGETVEGVLNGMLENKEEE